MRNFPRPHLKNLLQLINSLQPQTTHKGTTVARDIQNTRSIAMSKIRPELEFTQSIDIPSDGVKLAGDLSLPKDATGVVLFAHGSGSSRQSPRNQHVANVIRDAGVGTLLFDLLTKEEEAIDAYTGELRFNIDFLARRLVDATNWVTSQAPTQHLRIGYFGASTGAAAALVAAAELSNIVAAVVSRGGRPDLAGNVLDKVRAPTLLIVGGYDDVVIRLNEEAYAKLRCEKELKIVPGATHLFEERGTLDQVARYASDWFRRKLQPAAWAQTH
jgi:putative phosphoribosyl transferase